MPKMKYDWDKMKMEFILSEYNEAKSFMQDNYKIYNGEIAKNVKGWWKDKIAFKKKMYEDALKEKWKEVSKEISDKVKRYEMLDEEFIAWMEQQFEENKRTPKKGEKVRKLFSGDILNMRKIARTERWLPVNISKVEQTNKDERDALNEDEADALKSLLNKKK